MNEEERATLDVIAVKVNDIEAKVNAIAAFCAHLEGMLNAMSDNPMLAAMMPPGVLEPQG